jgi:hypothetical protein
VLDELYDSISRLWSWTWPQTTGEITAVDIERIKRYGEDSLRLAVAYKFSINSDGPYTGESFWQPAFCLKRRIIHARRKLRVHQRVVVRYRADDPSVSKLDRSLWKGI